MKINIWALEWHCKVDKKEKRKQLVYENCVPILFQTRKKARLYAEGRYGYIKTRKDLRDSPFGWRMPRPIKVHVTTKIKENRL